MVIPSLSSASLGLMQGVQTLTAQAAGGTTPLAFRNGSIAYGPSGAAAPAIAPLYDLVAANAPRTKGGAEAAAAQQKAPPGKIAAGALWLDGLMTTKQTKEVVPGQHLPIKLLGQWPARKILAAAKQSEPLGTRDAARLADFARGLAQRELITKKPDSGLCFLAAALLTGIDPHFYVEPAEAARAFANASRLFEREKRYGAAALAAEWGLATFVGNPPAYRTLCKGGEMWAKSLSRAPLAPSPIEAFFHGLTYALRTDDIATQGNLFASLADWYGRKKQSLEAGMSFLRAASLLTPVGLDVTGQPKDSIDDGDVKRYAVDVGLRLNRARQMLMQAADGQEKLRKAIDRFIDDATNLQIATV
jgi:hypothetical protein